MEKLPKIKLEIQEQTERIQSIRRFGGPQTDPHVETVMKMQNCCDEIKHVKELQVKNEREIDGVKYVLIAGLVLVAAVSYFFK